MGSNRNGFCRGRRKRTCCVFETNMKEHLFALTTELHKLALWLAVRINKLNKLSVETQQAGKNW